jgi:hypothetical protein
MMTIAAVDIAYLLSLPVRLYGLSLYTLVTDSAPQGPSGQ